MTIELGFEAILVYLLVFVRLSGMILFNPLLSRNGVPVMVRNGLVFFLTLMLAPLLPEGSFEAVYAMSGFGYVFAVVGEVFIGLVYGYVFQVFYHMLYFVGDVMDTDFGISMAKTFDPSSNIQVGFSGSLLTLLFALYVFATGSHFALFRMFATSFQSIHLGTFALTDGLLKFLLQMFTQVFSLALRLCAPFMVAEFILQASMGMLMKFIPQITVFVINFQLRIILGLLMLYTFAPYVGQFVDKYIDTMLNTLVNAAQLLATG